MKKFHRNAPQKTALGGLVAAAFKAYQDKKQAWRLAGKALEDLLVKRCARLAGSWSPSPVPVEVQSYHCRRRVHRR